MRIGSRALVTEAPHRARLTVLDKNDRLVCALGVNDEVCALEGFPNSRELVKPGKFITPHAVRPDPLGNLFVVEWIIGTHYEARQNLTRSNDLESKPTITLRRAALLGA